MAVKVRTAGISLPAVLKKLDLMVDGSVYILEIGMDNTCRDLPPPSDFLCRDVLAAD
jgi:hypothetical protein